MPDPKKGKVRVFANLNSAPLMSRISMASAAYATSTQNINAFSWKMIWNTYPFLPYFPRHICQSKDPTA